MGTSPRMRGKPVSDYVDEPELRNIPAYAGKTISRRAKDYSLSEHPRVCGENVTGISPTPAGEGTSPRMRGKPGQHHYAMPW